MNKKEFVSYFRELFPWVVKSKDYSMIAETWNNLTDAMVRDGQLHKRALGWSNPFDKRK